MQTANLESEVVAWMIAKLKMELADFWKIQGIQDFINAVEHVQEMELLVPEKKCSFKCFGHSGVIHFQKGDLPAEIFKRD